MFDTLLSHDLHEDFPFRFGITLWSVYTVNVLCSYRTYSFRLNTISRIHDCVLAVFITDIFLTFLQLEKPRHSVQPSSSCSRAMTAPTFTAPPQPVATRSRNPFENSYDPLEDLPRNPPPSRPKSRNPFELYDEDPVESDGAETGVWESEPTGTRSEPRFWQPRFYSAYFDITTSDFVARLFRALIPWKPLLGWTIDDEEQNGGTSVPDLYGPVWVTTTLVLALSMGAKIAEFLANVVRKRETSNVGTSLGGVEFARLWRAAGVLYFYVFAFPVMLTMFQCLFAKRSLQESGVRAHPMLGTIMVYGYSMTPVVVAALVATVPIELVQIVAMGVAFFIGAFMIMLNLWRDVSVRHRSLTYFVRAVAVAAHAGVGTAIIFIFYVGR